MSLFSGNPVKAIRARVWLGSDMVEPVIKQLAAEFHKTQNPLTSSSVSRFFKWLLHEKTNAFWLHLEGTEKLIGQWHNVLCKQGSAPCTMPDLKEEIWKTFLTRLSMDNGMIMDPEYHGAGNKMVDLFVTVVENILLSKLPIFTDEFQTVLESSSAVPGMESMPMAQRMPEVQRIPPPRDALYTNPNQVNPVDRSLQKQVGLKPSDPMYQQTLENPYIQSLPPTSRRGGMMVRLTRSRDRGNAKKGKDSSKKKKKNTRKRRDEDSSDNSESPSNDDDETDDEED